MRKAIVAGAAAVVLIVAAFVVAPTVWSQTTPAPRADRPEPPERNSRRLAILDGRGSSIGVSIRDLDGEEVAKAKLSQPGGVLIEDVDENSPAAKAGIREGDVIVEFDGERVRSARHFARLVQETVDGRPVKATVVRGGARQSVDVTPERRYADLLPHLGEDIEREVERGLRNMPRNFAFDFNWDGDWPTATVWPRGRLGAQLMPLTDQLADYFGTKSGALVSFVDTDSVAAKAGLKAGDVITSVNGRSVETPRDVVQELRQADAGTEVQIGVLRDKKSMTLKAQMPERRRSVERRTVRPA